jgi:phospholipase C
MSAMVVVLSIAACSTSSTDRAAVIPIADAGASSSPIKHVVIIIQENRSFENLFAGFPGADAPMYGRMHDGTKVRLMQSSLDVPDPCHEWQNGIQDWDNGKMDGFDLNCLDSGPAGGRSIYSYVRHVITAPYWALAQRYTLADRMFPTMFGPSFTSHLALIAATTSLSPEKAIVNSPSSLPWGCDAPAGTTNPLLDPARQILAGPFPCYSAFRTMADTLDAARLPWRYYAPTVNYGNGGGYWSAFDAIHNVRFGPDWSRNVISPSPRILTDVAKGDLAAVTWVVPDWPYSDHSGTGNMGPSWVAAITNAIGRSKFWKNTAIVILWDDWGGWYDNVPPPQLDYRGLGIRVGCIIVSPWAKPHYVSHTTYEFGSVLRFVEDTFELPRLGTNAAGYTDARANSLIDSFDFTQQPIGYKKVPAFYPPSTFLNMKPSNRLPDDI